MNVDDFKAAVMRAYPAMQAMARRMMRDREDAADAMQDAAVALWEHRDRFGTADN